MGQGKTAGMWSELVGCEPGSRMLIIAQTGCAVGSSSPPFPLSLSALQAGRGVEMLPSQNAPCSKGQVALQAAHIPYDWPCSSSQGGASTKSNLPQRQAGPWVKTPQAPLVAHVWQTFAAPGRHTPFFGNTTDYSRSQGYV